MLRIDMYACGLVLWEVASRTNLVEAPAAQPYRWLCLFLRLVKLLCLILRLVK